MLHQLSYKMILCLHFVKVHVHLEEWGKMSQWVCWRTTCIWATIHNFCHVPFKFSLHSPFSSCCGRKKPCRSSGKLIFSQTTNVFIYFFVSGTRKTISAVHLESNAHSCNPSNVIVYWIYQLQTLSEIEKGENEAAQCGLQQTPSPVKTEPNHRGYS